MRHRSVAELMTPEVITVRPATAFKELARLLKEFDITAMPVIEETGHPVGAVCEADLLRQQPAGEPATA
ncbi:CBS domain-containing protein [Streptomyces sp. NPDC001272]